MKHLVKMMKINKFIILLIFCTMFFSCSKKWIYTINPIVVKNKGKESIMYPHLYDKYGKLHATLFASDICVIFENSMIDSDISVFSSVKGQLFKFTIKDKNKNNVSKLIYLPSASTKLLINLDNSSYVLKEDMYMKFTFLIVKKRNEKYILTFTNNINYKLTEKQLKTSSDNYSHN